MDSQPSYWILEKTQNARFPYRLSIRQADENYIVLRAQHHWPGSKGNVFCIREIRFDSDEVLEQVEKVRIISMNEFGKRLSISLDRPVRKRCDFLFLKKKYKNTGKEYEQIFWQTQKGLEEKRPKVRFATRGTESHKVIIDPNERYAYSFPGFKEVKGNLPVGDYAVLVEHDIRAVVERKTYDNILRDFSDMQILHQKLFELESYSNAALVIESEYSEFLKPKKTSFPVSYITKALAEISALHPKVTTIFTGNRKLANEWCRAYFLQVGNLSSGKEQIFSHHSLAGVNNKGRFFEVRKQILSNLPKTFDIENLNNLFNKEEIPEIKKYLKTMEKWQDVRKEGRGKATAWFVL